MVFMSYLTCLVAQFSAAEMCVLVNLVVAGVLEERLVFSGSILISLPLPGTWGGPHMLSSPRPPRRVCHRQQADPPPNCPHPGAAGPSSSICTPGLSAAGFPLELLVFIVLNFIYYS